MMSSLHNIKKTCASTTNLIKKLASQFSLVTFLD